MTVQETIERKLGEALAPIHLEVVNESHMHAVPPGSESHFKLIVVPDRFEGEPLIRRHQRVNAILADEIAGPVHALSMQTHTPAEWQRRGGRILESPECLGGGKAESGHRG